MSMSLSVCVWVCVGVWVCVDVCGCVQGSTRLFQGTKTSVHFLERPHPLPLPFHIALNKIVQNVILWTPRLFLFIKELRLDCHAKAEKKNITAMCTIINSQLRGLSLMHSCPAQTDMITACSHVHACTRRVILLGLIHAKCSMCCYIGFCMHRQ